MSTSIPAAIAHVVTGLRSWSPLSGVTVYDGPPVKVTGRKDYICIGHTPDTDAIGWTREWSQIGALRQEEDYDLPCSAMVWSGGTDMSIRRTRAFALLDEVAAFIATDRTFGGVLRSAAINKDGSLGQAQTAHGAAADLRFVIECQTRIQA